MAASVKGHGTDEPRSGVQGGERALGVLHVFQYGAAEQTTLDPGGRAWAAVKIQGPTVRMSASSLESLGALVRGAADEIGRLVGYGSVPG